MRLTKIYTRAGDQGDTHFAGEKIPKDDIRIELAGAIDELISFIGLALSFIAKQHTIYLLLVQIQQRLFDIGGELHSPDYSIISAEHITFLETCIDDFNKALPPLKEFVLPQGPTAASTCHVARSVCRRTERVMITYLRQYPNFNRECLRFLNRLSDLLFVMARVLAREVDEREVLWRE